jgi:hypothetical protein
MALPFSGTALNYTSVRSWSGKNDVKIYYQNIHDIRPGNLFARTETTPVPRSEMGALSPVYAFFLDLQGIAHQGSGTPDDRRYVAGYRLNDFLKTSV